MEDDEVAEDELLEIIVQMEIIQKVFMMENVESLLKKKSKSKKRY
jgi:hypothetical protein